MQVNARLRQAPNRYRHYVSAKQGIKNVDEVPIYLCEVRGFFAEDSGGACRALLRRG